MAEKGATTARHIDARSFRLTLPCSTVDGSVVVADVPQRLMVSLGQVPHEPNRGFEGIAFNNE